MTAYEFSWRCACGRAGVIAWAHAHPPPQLDEAQRCQQGALDLFSNVPNKKQALDVVVKA